MSQKRTDEPRRFDVLDVHIYGGALLMALGIGGRFGAWIGVATLGALLFFIAVRR